MFKRENVFFKRWCILMWMVILAHTELQLDIRGHRLKKNKPNNDDTGRNFWTDQVRECILVSRDESYQQWRHSYSFTHECHLISSRARNGAALNCHIHCPLTHTKTHAHSSGAEGSQTNILIEDLIRSRERERGLCELKFQFLLLLIQSARIN